MTVINRHRLKSDYPFLIEFIQKHHEMGPEIFHALYIEHTPVKNLDNQRYYFATFPMPELKAKTGSQVYIRYLMSHIITDVQATEIARRVNEVVLYDSFLEYETERVKQLSTSDDKMKTGLNLN